MSDHLPVQNPGVEVHDTSPEDAMQPHAPDFAETPDIRPLSAEKEPLPTWLYLVCGVALFLAGSSFTGFQMFGQDMLDQGPGGPAMAGAGEQAAEMPASPAELGKKVYGQNCANCHQGSGMGQPGAYPPLAGSEWVQGSKERLTALLLKGIQGPLNVKGACYQNQIMPAQEAALTPEKLANLMTYMRSAWGNTAGPVTTDEVSAAKAKVASRTTAYDEPSLLAIAPHGPDPTDKK